MGSKHRTAVKIIRALYSYPSKSENMTTRKNPVAAAIKPAWPRLVTIRIKPMTLYLLLYYSAFTHCTFCPDCLPVTHLLCMSASAAAMLAGGPTSSCIGTLRTADLCTPSSGGPVGQA